MRQTLLYSCLMIISGCATMGQVMLTEGGSHVVASPNAPAPDCENRGTVIGETRGSTLTSAGQHTLRAVDDARNKAAALGANYLQTTTPQLTQSPYGPTGAIVTGAAFACRGQALSSPAQPASTP